MTVSPRYQDLGLIREDFHLRGRFGVLVLRMQEAYLCRFYAEIQDHDWRQIASATNFAEYQKNRRLDLIEAEEAEQGDEVLCPQTLPPIRIRQWFRGPYNSECIWNLPEIVPQRGAARLLTLVDIRNALQSMGKQDQDKFKFQMTRVLSISRLLESRCQSLFEGLIEEQQKHEMKQQRRKRHGRVARRQSCPA